jgi:hypothetical protein
MDGTIIPYEKTVYIGDLKYDHGRVKGMTEHVMELFLNAPPWHFIGTLMYFYHYQPDLENPITVSAYGDSVTTHPGQGRLLSCYFRGHETIKSLLIPLHETQDERDLLFNVAKNVTPYSKQTYQYDNQNHHGISTKEFEDYFYPTDVRLDYEDKKEELLNKYIYPKGRFTWTFNDRKSITLGKKKFSSTIIECKTAEGFYHSLFYIAYGHFKKSKLFSIRKI